MSPRGMLQKTAFVIGCIAAAAPASAQTYVNIAPPAPIVETRPGAPGSGYAWIPGHWRWNGARYVWVRGHWSAAPSPYRYWVAGHWAEGSRGRWHWVDGHWR